jgi:hypothetical protein
MTIYLYVKQHSVTGVKYFGKTEKVDPYKYRGSGTYWANHIKKHGNFIETVDLWGFDDQEICTEFALTFSKNNGIVESKEWANLMPENGLDGGSAKGRTRSAETRTRMSLALKGKMLSEETRAKLSIVNKGKTHSAETRVKMSLAAKGRTISAETRTKLSLVAKGRTISAETRAKLSLANKGKPKSTQSKIGH